MNSPYQDWKRDQIRLKWARRAAYFGLGLLLVAVLFGKVGA